MKRNVDLTVNMDFSDDDFRSYVPYAKEITSEESLKNFIINSKSKSSPSFLTNLTNDIHLFKTKDILLRPQKEKVTSLLDILNERYTTFMNYDFSSSTMGDIYNNETDTGALYYDNTSNHCIRCGESIPLILPWSNNTSELCNRCSDDLIGYKESILDINDKVDVKSFSDVF